MDEISPELIADVFGIPRDGKNIDDDDDDDGMGIGNVKATTPFEEKVKDVVSELSNVPSGKNLLTEKTAEIPKEKNSVSPKEEVEKALKSTVPIEKKPDSTRQEKKSVPPSIANLFDDDIAPETSVAAKPEPPKVEAPKVPLKEIEPVKVDASSLKVLAKKVEAPMPNTTHDDDDSERETVGGPGKSGQQWSDDDRWLLRSPGPKYDRLYHEKQIALGNGSRSILKGGEIKFDEWFEELANSNIDITVKTFDPRDIHEKMQQVQQLRTRVEYIRLRVSQQYHHWERFIELFHGVLCRTEYERGKQEGLYYEHLRDMEHYFCSLKSLYKAAEGVMRTLDGAFECLSRQVTILLPMKEIERHSNGASVAAKPPTIMTSSLKKLDSLPTNANETKSDEGVPAAWAL
jgi:hypothetical protein